MLILFKETISKSLLFLLLTFSLFYLEDYDCIGFDLDHTLCRYNVGPMIRYFYTVKTRKLCRYNVGPMIKYFYTVKTRKLGNRKKTFL